MNEIMFKIGLSREKEPVFFKCRRQFQGSRFSLIWYFVGLFPSKVRLFTGYKFLQFGIVDELFS